MSGKRDNCEIIRIITIFYLVRITLTIYGVQL